MSTDKDLESIKKGNGLSNSSTTSSNSNSSGTTTEQRGQNSGIRIDIFTRQGTKREGEK